MPIFKGSRYEYSTVDFVATTPNGDANPIVFYYMTQLGKVRFYEHTYVQGERLDQIAYRYYNDSTYWWIIPEFNPEVKDFTNIPNGTVLRIPNV
jgi:nucleoid-associated protein YgaU